MSSYAADTRFCYFCQLAATVSVDDDADATIEEFLGIQPAFVEVKLLFAVGVEPLKSPRWLVHEQSRAHEQSQSLTRAIADSFANGLPFSMLPLILSDAATDSV